MADDDDALAQYYVGSDLYVDRARDRADKAALFVGPKGVGKSAILQMVRLLEAGSGNAERVIDIAPDDLAFTSLLNIKATTPLLQEAGRHQWLFKSLWDYVLSVEILEREVCDRTLLLSILEKCIGNAHAKQKRELLRITLADDGSTRRSFTDHMLALVEQLHLSGEIDGAKLSAGAELRNRVPSSNDLELLQLVSNVAKNLPSELKHDYYVLVDDLDLHWQGTPLQNAFIGTLLYSMRKLSTNRRVKFVISLRRHIYRQIDVEERDKFADFKCDVSWGKAHVQRMVEDRLSYVLAIESHDVWDGLFADVDFDSIWRQTNGMPREVIRLTVACVTAARKAGAAAVSQEHFETAAREFSESRLDDLSSDYQYELPDLKRVVRQFRGKKKEFDSEELREIAMAVVEVVEHDESARCGWATMGFEDPAKLGRELVRVGFLLHKHGRTDEARALDDDELDEVSEVSWFAIHPMYVLGLGVA